MTGEVAYCLNVLAVQEFDPYLNSKGRKRNDPTELSSDLAAHETNPSQCK